MQNPAVGSIVGKEEGSVGGGLLAGRGRGFFEGKRRGEINSIAQKLSMVCGERFGQKYLGQGAKRD